MLKVSFMTVKPLAWWFPHPVPLPSPSVLCIRHLGSLPLHASFYLFLLAAPCFLFLEVTAASSILMSILSND